MAHLLEKIQNKISTHSVHEEAPVVKERIHEHAEHVDKTRVEEAHERTKVIQTVQPIVDEKREGTRTRVEDHGLEIHEHGREGLDKKTLAELEARRLEIQSGAGTTYDRTESETHSRPDISVSERTHTVEQVVPVMERDIYKNERIEHEKREVHIHHEKAVLEGTRVAPAITVEQWKSQDHNSHHSHGGLTSDTHGLGSGSSSHKLGGMGSSSSSSSSSASSHKLGSDSHGLGTDSRTVGSDSHTLGSDSHSHTLGSDSHGLGHKSHNTLGPDCDGLGSNTHGTHSTHTGSNTVNGVGNDGVHHDHSTGSHAKKGTVAALLDKVVG